MVLSSDYEPIAAYSAGLLPGRGRSKSDKAQITQPGFLFVSDQCGMR